MARGISFATALGMRHPAAPPALALLAGVFLGCTIHVSPPGAAAVALVIWLLAFVFLARRLTVPCVLACVLGAGVCGASLGSLADDQALHPSLRDVLIELRGTLDLPDGPSGVVVLTGRLTEDGSPSPSGGTRLALDAIAIETEGRPRPVDGGVVLNVAGEADPQRLDAWRAGRVVRLPVQLRRPSRYLDPGVPDFERASARRGVTLVGSAKSSLLVEVLQAGGWFDEAAAGVRAWSRRALDRVVGRYGARSAAIARAVILGDRTGLDDETQERLQEAGTYHVIAISGGNIAILAGVLLALLRLFITRAGVVDVAVAAALVAYAGIVGGGASVVRATVMAVIFLLAHAVDARGRPLNTLACAAGLSLAAEPLIIFDAGAWLTYGATLAIIIGTPIVFAALPPLPRVVQAVAALFVASLSAELALLPVAASVFNRVTAAGLVLNFAAIPLMSVVQVGGMVCLALAVLAPPVASLVGAVTHGAAWGLVESARLVDLMPWAVTRTPSPSPVVIALYYAAWIAWFALRSPLGSGLQRSPGVRLGPDPNRRRRGVSVVRGGAVAALVVTGAWIVLAPVMPWTHSGQLRVTFIDVGQGDATLVEFPSGQTLMVDAGPTTGGRFDIARRIVEPVVWERGVRRLGVLSLSHGDADHTGGAPSVLKDLRPIEVWEGVPVPTHEPLRAAHEAAQRAGAAWRNVRLGDRAVFGGVDVIVWHPPPPEWERPRVRNDDSTVIELRIGQVSIVLPGDVERPGESDLARLVHLAPLTVAQAPHHGSASSSSKPWIDAEHPTVVMISVGRNNRFGHPHPSVLARYRAAGAVVFRTDQDGAVTLETDGRQLRVSGFTGRQFTFQAPAAGHPPPS